MRWTFSWNNMINKHYWPKTGRLSQKQNIYQKQSQKPNWSKNKLQNFLPKDINETFLTDNVQSNIKLNINWEEIFPVHVIRCSTHASFWCVDDMIYKCHLHNVRMTCMSSRRQQLCIRPTGFLVGFSGEGSGGPGQLKPKLPRSVKICIWRGVRGRGGGGPGQLEPKVSRSVQICIWRGVRGRGGGGPGQLKPKVSRSDQICILEGRGGGGGSDQHSWNTWVRALKEFWTKNSGNWNV